MTEREYCEMIRRTKAEARGGYMLDLLVAFGFGGFVFMCFEALIRVTS